MPNKHFCQGPDCHTNPTSDRFLKSKGIIRGRYAMWDRNQSNEYHARAKYFCSLTCESAWLNVNMENIEHGRPIAFITHRRITEGYRKVTENNGWHSYKTIQKIGVDNNAELE